MSDEDEQQWRREILEAGTIRPAPPRIVAVTSVGRIGKAVLRRMVTDGGLGAAVTADFIAGVLLAGLPPRHRTTRSVL